jgi:hypothetical protein
MFARRNKARSPSQAARRTRKLQLETLESRAMLAVFTVVNTNDSGDGSLRAAIESANSTPGEDSIRFNIPGVGVQTIRLESPLPNVSDRVSIFGFTQRENQGGRIEITPASGAAIDWGLTVTANNSVVREFTINGFTRGAIRVLGSANIIDNNHLGVNSLSNRVPVRGTAAGVLLEGGAQQNTIRNNVIAGQENGIWARGATTRWNIITGNTIGLLGLPGLGNGVGILISDGAHGMTIGSTASSTAGRNHIRGNESSGIVILSNGSTSNVIHSNIIHSNGGLAIDLGGDGATRNDYLDRDVGPNQLMNSPLLQSAIDMGNRLEVHGRIHAVPNQTYFVTLYASSDKHASGQGFAQRVIGAASRIRTNAEGDGWFKIDASTIPSGWFVSAVATNQFNNSSEMSHAIEVNARAFAPPILGWPNANVTYVAQSPPLILAPGGQVIDADTPHFKGGWLSVRVAQNAQATDRLTILHQGNGAGQIGVSGNQVSYGGTVIGTFSGGDGSNSLVIGLNSNATPVAVQALMRRMAFDSTDANPSTARRLIQFQLGDGRGNASNAFGWLDVE